MKAIFWLILASLTACTPTSKTTFEAEKEKQAIAAIMNQQQEAWNQHNLEGFMQPYWQSDSLIFIGSRGITYGWQSTLENYQKSYGNAERMGTLKFENDHIEILQDKSAMVAGRWSLFRLADTLSGSYLLVWHKKNGKWQIIADHSS